MALKHYLIDHVIYEPNVWPSGECLTVHLCTTMHRYMDYMMRNAWKESFTSVSPGVSLSSFSVWGMCGFHTWPRLPTHIPAVRRGGYQCSQKRPCKSESASGAVFDHLLSAIHDSHIYGESGGQVWWVSPLFFAMVLVNFFRKKEACTPSIVRPFRRTF
jgi:hypothetical protein